YTNNVIYVYFQTCATHCKRSMFDCVWYTPTHETPARYYLLRRLLVRSIMAKFLQTTPCKRHVDNGTPIGRVDTILGYDRPPCSGGSVVHTPPGRPNRNYL